MDNITATKQKDPQPISVRYFTKMKGKGRSPLQVNVKDSLTGLLGGFLTILTLTYLTSITSTELLMAPFGASCVLAFGVWNAPLSQPRNIIGGHLISTFIGLSIYHLFGNEYWTIALAVGMAIAVMMLTRTTHPPAGADPIIVILGANSWSYLVTPVLIGSVVIVVIALFLNNMSSKRSYPTFWV
ncbi:HPP family protein [Bacillus thuringiensis]|uniref:HPP family protein n=3 Tax=Bacillus cereus group TaxID=86661 RepID=A0ABD5HVF0_BACTU|nr:MULTISPECIES: HPP family protein [Bacillus]AXR15529.1 HPP family protein [Bacillus sp. CR71]AXR21263.1 HPP family protein [Bacillus sp. E25]EEM97717.1 CBS domain protein [Bacillus thuringiensis IBL 200]KAA6462771.1 HPP family protein [Bacillus cereus]KAB2422144.1 HPP family protein [Bacillus cereus]